MVRMFAERIDDGALLRLIRKWLKAGVLDTDGQVLHPVTGTPQGGTVSSLAAHISLHDVLDWWADRWRRQHARGDVIIVRDADDCMVGFAHRDDAAQFWRELQERFGTFNLVLHPEQTRRIEFGRCAVERRQRRAQGKPEPFDFLGLTHTGSKTRSGQCAVRRKMIAQR